MIRRNSTTGDILQPVFELQKVRVLMGQASSSKSEREEFLSHIYLTFNQRPYVFIVQAVLC